MTTQQQPYIPYNDPALPNSGEPINPVVHGNIFITNINEYTTIRVSSPGEPAGNTTEVQFNLNGQMDGDDGLTYNPTTDSLDVLGNLTAANVLTDNLLYANGVAWSFSGSTYSNANVTAYLPTYTGNFNVTNVVATLFAGSGANLTNIPAGNIVGSISSATTAGTVTTAAQPNITAVGTLTSLSVTNTISGNVSGSAATATTAGTVTTAAQPNITSTGSLTGLTVSNATGVVNFTTTANVTLGAVGNLHISGGTSGQVLSTNGSDVLSWATPSVGSLQSVTESGNTTDQAIEVTNTTASTNYSTGALKVSGGVGVGGNLHTQGHVAAKTTVYAGQYADLSSWNNPVFVGKDAGTNYVQAAMVNSDDNGSADWIAYGESSTTDTGWSDMGFTSTQFNDPLYTITKPSDGYFFVQGLDSSHGGPQGGNLVLATGGDGSNNDIVFALGSFYANAEYARMDDDSNTFYVGGHAYGTTSENPTPRVVNLNVNGNANVGGNVTLSGTTTLGPVGNVKITGGTDGQVLTTDGAGNLSFTTVSGGGGNSISDGSSNVTVTSTDGNVVIGVDNDVMNWTFAMDGNIYSKSDTDLTLIASDTNGGGYKVKQVVTDGSVELSRTSLEDGQFSIYTNLDSTAEEWRFSGNTLQVTNNSTVKAFGSNVVVESMYVGSGNGTASLRSVSNSNDPNIFTTFDATTTGANISVYNGGSNGGTGYTWKFDNNGNLTLPGSIIPSTNVTYDLGNSSNSFGNLYVANVTATGTITATGKIGYANGGTVTQTGTGQGVTLHQLTGQITLAKSSWNAGDLEIFNVTCNKVGTYDYVMAQVINGTESTFFNVVAFPYVPIANQFQIQVRAMETTTSTPLIQFYIMKASIT